MVIVAVALGGIALGIALVLLAAALVLLQRILPAPDNRPRYRMPPRPGTGHHGDHDPPHTP